MSQRISKLNSGCLEIVENSRCTLNCTLGHSTAPQTLIIGIITRYTASWHDARTPQSRNICKLQNCAVSSETHCGSEDAKQEPTACAILPPLVNRAQTYTMSPLVDVAI